MEKAVLLRKNELELMNLKVELLKKEGIIGKLELEIVDLKSESIVCQRCGSKLIFQRTVLIA